ncbi:MAG: YciI family protein [Micrococcales bacterium]
MKFIIFVIDDGNNLANPSEMANIDAFNQMLIDNHHFIHAAGINHGEHATLIDNRKDLNHIKQGSLYNEPAHYSGFWLIEATDENQALDLAKQGSKACNRKVELRPYLR